MRFVLYLLLFFHLEVLGCGASRSGDSSSDESGGTNARPSDESEEISGYLVNPENLVAKPTGQDTFVSIVAEPGTVTVGANQDTFVAIWGADFGASETEITNLVLIAAAKIEDDGSFVISFNPDGYQTYFLQTVYGAPGKFEVITDGSVNTNTLKYVNANGEVVPDKYFASPEISSAVQESSPISLIYMNKVPQVMSSTVEAQIEIHNPGSESLNLNGMEIRYYFDADGYTPEIELTTATNIPAESMQYAYNSTSKYIYFSIVANHQVSAGDHAKIRFTVVNTEGQNFDQSNDMSFIMSQTSKGLSYEIDVFSNGQKIWGN